MVVLQYFHASDIVLMCVLVRMHYAPSSDVKVSNDKIIPTGV